MMRSSDISPATTEADAGRLLPALESVAAAVIPASRDADRHAIRLRFALGRVADLRQRIETRGGVFEPARLEVAQSILQMHYRRAASFAVTTGVAAPVATGNTTRFASSQSVAAYSNEPVEVIPEKKAA